VRVWLCVALLTLLLHGCTEEDPSPRGDSVSERLAEVVDRHVEQSYAPGMRNVRAVLVSVDGELLVERYFDSGPDETAPIASVTKSIVSTLVGIAVDEGLLSLDQTLDQLLPGETGHMSPNVAAITLRQLLTMTAGLPEDPPSRRPVTSGDWVAEILERGTAQPPGAGFVYSSVSSHLLAAALVEATGRPVLDYAREKLFDPLGVDTHPAFQPLILPGEPDPRRAYRRAGFAWPRDPQGIHIGGADAKLTAPEMLAFGTLFLNGGVLNDTELVPASWVEEATSRLVETRTPLAEHYGYQWWVTEAGDHAAYAALGFGGQIIEVVPDLELVVVASTWIDPVATLDSATWEFMVDQAIVPALEPEA
jgi:CubicO group peptidase (beta-lactamase class C family)